MRCNQCQSEAAVKFQCQHSFCQSCSEIALNITHSCFICHSFPFCVSFNFIDDNQIRSQFTDAQDIIKCLTNQYSKLPGFISQQLIQDDTNKNVSTLQYVVNNSLNPQTLISKDDIRWKSKVLCQLQKKLVEEVITVIPTQSEISQIGQIVDGQVCVGKNFWADFIKYKQNLLVNFSSAQYCQKKINFQSEIGEILTKLQKTYSTSIKNPYPQEQIENQSMVSNQPLNPLLQQILYENSNYLIIDQFHQNLIIYNHQKQISSVPLSSTIRIIPQPNESITFPLLRQKIKNFTKVCLNTQEQPSITSRLPIPANQPFIAISGENFNYMITPLPLSPNHFHDTLQAFSIKSSIGSQSLTVICDFVTIRNFIPNSQILANFRYNGGEKQIGIAIEKLQNFALVKWNSGHTELINIESPSTSEISYL